MDALKTIWRRIEEPESPLRVTKSLASGLNHIDRISAILKLQKELLPSVKNLSPPPGEKILAPLRDREEQLAKAAELFRLNCTSYTRTTERKNSHTFLTVTAGTGFGKTRFCNELGQLLQKTELVRKEVCFDYQSSIVDNQVTLFRF